jgi:predicted nucleic acid-binding protein
VRIVFDTNVLFSAFVAHGACAGLYEECLLGARVVVSQPILDELRVKLVDQAGLSPGEAEEVVQAVTSDAEVVAPRCLHRLVGTRMTIWCLRRRLRRMQTPS